MVKRLEDLEDNTSIVERLEVLEDTSILERLITLEENPIGQAETEYFFVNTDTIDIDPSASADFADRTALTDPFCVDADKTLDFKLQMSVNTRI